MKLRGKFDKLVKEKKSIQIVINSKIKQRILE